LKLEDIKILAELFKEGVGSEGDLYTVVKSNILQGTAFYLMKVL
jgi:hypothetical protein